VKKLLLLFGLLLLIVIVFSGFFYFPLKVMDLKNVTEANVYFQHDTIEASGRLNDTELASLKAIFNGKIAYRDNPSCGFSDNVSIKLGSNQTLWIAHDTCPVIYWKEENRYITLSEDEQTLLYNLLKAYGFRFPCV